jgi:FxsC-like protein
MSTGTPTGESELVPTGPMSGMQRALRPLAEMTPGPERWLSLVLVVDASPSMQMWHPLARELHNVLRGLGAFRDVRICYMVENDGKLAVASGPAGGVPLTPGALIDPSGRQLMLVLSDCAGPRWWDGSAGSVVRLWALSNLTAILQPLPERLWRRTAAPTVPGLASTTSSGAPNSGIRFAPFEDSDSEPADAVAVPVLELDPEWLADWAALVIGTGNGSCPTAVTWLPRDATVEEPPGSEQQLPIEERVMRFLSVASPLAAKLAGHLAVAIPALPVMRLVQRQLIPASTPSHLAEVILSGLLRPLDAERGSYEFVAGAREALLTTMPRSQSLQIVEKLRRVSENTASVADVRPFTLVSTHALELLSHTTISVHDAASDVMGHSLDTMKNVGTLPRSRIRRIKRPYFFLSYARTPKRDPTDREDPDRWVYKLYRDLCAVILQLTDAEPDEAGFMDRENKLGTEWSPELINALQECRVFVPLYSRRYFESSYCGKEWFAFARRELTSRARGAEVMSAIVPALWTRMSPDRLPNVAQSVQFEHSTLGERYSAEGFYGIMKLQNYRADYQRAVHRLAERIVDIGDASVAHADEVAPRDRRPPDFESLPSAFGPESVARMSDGQLHISVLAHDVSTLPPGRAGDYYGETPHTWSPYRPEYQQPVADYAGDLARKCLDFKPLVGSFSNRRWRSGGDTHQMPPALCLVDAWTAVSAAHREQLKLLNEIEEPWVSVLVPWNSNDAGLRAAERELHQKLREHLGRKLDSVPRRCEMAATGIPTLQEFSQILPEMTMTMLKRFRKAAPAHPPSGPVIERPRLRRADANSGESR